MEENLEPSKVPKKKHVVLEKPAIIGLILVIAVFLAIATKTQAGEKIEVPKEYVIHTENYIDYQPHYECSGYSSAYVLRSLGVDIKGMDLYNSIPDKSADGTVPIECLTEYLRGEGYRVKVYTGSLNNLKAEVCKGTPVIAFVRVGPNEKYYHYLPVVGYDEENVFTADSLSYKKNTDDQYYNRLLSNEDFLNMWDTGIYKKNTYITIALQ